MEQKKKKLTKYDDLYDAIRYAAMTGDYETAKDASEILSSIIWDKNTIPKRKGYTTVKADTKKDDDFYSSYEGQWVKEYNLPAGASIYDHVEHQQFDQECEHEPIEVGFSISKVVCKKCDKELPQEALYGKKTFQ